MFYTLDYQQLHYISKETVTVAKFTLNGINHVTKYIDLIHLNNIYIHVTV